MAREHSSTPGQRADMVTSVIPGTTTTAAKPDRNTVTYGCSNSPPTFAISLDLSLDFSLWGEATDKLPLFQIWSIDWRGEGCRDREYLRAESISFAVTAVARLLTPSPFAVQPHHFVSSSSPRRRGAITVFSLVVPLSDILRIFSRYIPKSETIHQNIPFLKLFLKICNAALATCGILRGTGTPYPTWPGRPARHNAAGWTCGIRQMPQVGHAALGFQIFNPANASCVLDFSILPSEVCDFGDSHHAVDHDPHPRRRPLYPGRGPRESATVTIWRCEREFRALPPPSAPIVELVRQAGFFGLLNMQYMQLDLALLTALVERWRPETHTFHLTSGEATVTLQDVEIITGLPVDGRPVTGSTDLNWEQMVRDLLGLELEEAGR
ncbi:hypothetical protein Vadar_001186 [Vaccinium darrowii]|uniref:Uncharacterized protein n=1 Tax=Vaccinium darrowii TaxID=229202 RepID=A0ACB7WWG7_9ERIC|nr:hypothetical protein Vadar_001186 [Vaccinium darrowii]